MTSRSAGAMAVKLVGYAKISGKGIHQIGSVDIDNSILLGLRLDPNQGMCIIPTWQTTNLLTATHLPGWSSAFVDGDHQPKSKVMAHISMSKEKPQDLGPDKGTV